MIKFQFLSEYLQSINLSTTESVNELVKTIKHRGMNLTSWQKEMILNACDNSVKDYLENLLREYACRKQQVVVQHRTKPKAQLKGKMKPKASRNVWKSPSDVKPIYVLDNSKRWV